MPEASKGRSQHTIGGSEYFVQGKITSIDKEKNYYWVKQPSGDEIRVKVTEATNMVCPSRSDTQGTSGKNVPFEPGATPMETGASKDASTGFRIGNCPFQVGDFVKIETTDMGRATFIRTVFKTVPEHQVPMPEDMAAEAGMPNDYLWLPVPLGHLAATGTPLKTVRSSDGERLGTLDRVIIDRRGGHIEYGIVTLSDSGRLMPIPWEAFEVVDEDGVERIVRIKMRKQQMLDIPTFSMDAISTAKVRQYWEGEVGPSRKAMLPSYAASWVKDMVDDYHRLSAFDQAFKDAPYMPQTMFRAMNDAAEDLEQGKRYEAVEHFRDALRQLDRGVEHHAVSKTAAEKLKALVVMHAPQRFMAALEPKDQKPSIKMQEAIAIARDTYPGEVIDAEYLGEYGKDAYRVAIMAGTGVTHAVVVDADTGLVRKDVPEPGHPMPNEPFR